MKTFLIVIFLIYFVHAEKARYDNYRVYEINIENDNQLELMQEIEKYPDGYRFMELPRSTDTVAKIIVPPHKFADFSELTERFAIKSRLAIKNLQEVFDNEQSRRRKSDLDWTFYWNLEEINQWLESLTVKYPNDVTLLNIGESYEGRGIIGIKINIGGGSGKKSVMFEGTHHAREWISAATITYMTNEILTSTDPEIVALARNYEWYIFPVTNPDGYDYSWKKDRFWRKTRRPSSIVCIGADPNRNWDNFFNQGGTSFNPCADTYAGSHPFSEPETRQLAEFIKQVPNLAVYIPFHSYSQILMLPYGWTYELLENYDEVYEIGLKAVEKLRSYFGTNYRLGAIANVLYIATGASIDWVKYELKTNVTLEYELRDTGAFGFALPADQIIENSIEVFGSVVTILQEAQKIGIA